MTPTGSAGSSTAAAAAGDQRLRDEPVGHGDLEPGSAPEDTAFSSRPLIASCNDHDSEPGHNDTCCGSGGSDTGASRSCKCTRPASSPTPQEARHCTRKRLRAQTPASLGKSPIAIGTYHSGNENMSSVEHFVNGHSEATVGGSDGSAHHWQQQPPLQRRRATAPHLHTAPVAVVRSAQQAAAAAAAAATAAAEAIAAPAPDAALAAAAQQAVARRSAEPAQVHVQAPAAPARSADVHAAAAAQRLLDVKPRSSRGSQAAAILAQAAGAVFRPPVTVRGRPRTAAAEQSRAGCKAAAPRAPPPTDADVRDAVNAVEAAAAADAATAAAAAAAAAPAGRTAAAAAASARLTKCGKGGLRSVDTHAQALSEGTAGLGPRLPVFQLPALSTHSVPLSEHAYVEGSVATFDGVDAGPPWGPLRGYAAGGLRVTAAGDMLASPFAMRFRRPWEAQPLGRPASAAIGYVQMVGDAGMVQAVHMPTGPAIASCFTSPSNTPTTAPSLAHMNGGGVAAAAATTAASGHSSSLTLQELDGAYSYAPVEYVPATDARWFDAA
ncbi:hypothetical protein JKP88DRAFT_263887 [Tribonema minus]|uniref:Uncharacterized protein n=1 Tax=Tribonema minus TaxID=303371 RepID=A0A836CC88_9STRA|nr:hypothetical protein JKP88DRAFT_263887 [Tribonema minus]